MSKKSQVTVFIIIGVVILFSVCMLLSFKARNHSDVVLSGNNIGNIDRDEVENYINSALTLTLRESLLKITQQGGVFIPVDYREYVIAGARKKVAYGLKDYIPLLTAESVEDEICKAVLSGLPQKLDLSFVEKRGVDYSVNTSVDAIVCKATISSSRTSVKLNMPVVLTQADARVRLEEFSSSIDISLGEAINVSSQIIDDIISSPGALDLSAYDFSCHKIKAFYEDKIVTVMQYKPWDTHAGLKLYFAVDEPLENACSSMEKLNTGNCP